MKSSAKFGLWGDSCWMKSGAWFGLWASILVGWNAGDSC